jgi:hypothetical protein
MYYGNEPTPTTNALSNNFDTHSWTSSQGYYYDNQIAYKASQSSPFEQKYFTNNESVDEKNACYMKTQYERLQANRQSLYWNDYIENIKYFSNGNYHSDAAKRLSTNPSEQYVNISSASPYIHSKLSEFETCSSRDFQPQDQIVSCSNKPFGYKYENHRLTESTSNFKNFKSADENSRESDLSRNGATLRERNRMHILNDAFDDLRKIVPKSNLSEHQRLSKIATLRLAIHYIGTLTKVLQNTGGILPLSPSLLPITPRRRRRKKNAINNEHTGMNNS